MSNIITVACLLFLVIVPGVCNIIAYPLSHKLCSKISNLIVKGVAPRLFRLLKAYKKFIEMPLPSFGPDLSFLNFDDYTYFIKSSKGVEKVKARRIIERIKQLCDIIQMISENKRK
mgnify:CR=1 FL=1